MVVDFQLNKKNYSRFSIERKKLQEIYIREAGKGRKKVKGEEDKKEEGGRKGKKDDKGRNASFPLFPFPFADICK